MWLYNPFDYYHLVTCRLGVLPPTSPVTTLFTYRALRRIDKQALGRNILQSRLYGSHQSDADEYADLFDAEVTRVLEIHAPLRTGRGLCSGQHDTYVLSDEAAEAKRHRRRAKRRYGRTGLPSDKQAFKAACNTARPASRRHGLTTSGRNCSKRQATSQPHGALRSHCCTADKR